MDTNTEHTYTLQQNVPLAEYTTLKVGGPAEYFAVVQDEEMLRAAVEDARRQGMSIRMIGGGSNILVPDNGLSGLTIKNNITGWQETVDGNVVRICVGAGEVFDDVVARTVAKGYWGLENLSHIPGSVGATPVQNVGAYGVEIQDRIDRVRVYNCETDAYEELTAAECQFGYRDSLFKTPEGQKYFITHVTFLLGATPQPVLSYKDLEAVFADEATPQLAAIRDAVIAIRAQKFPDWTVVGTAGSFFKNPVIPKSQYESLSREYPELPGFPVSDTEVKVPLGWILDKICHLRGASDGVVGTYEGQALVVVTTGGATATDITAFAHTVAASVKEKTGISIEWEVTQLRA